MTLIVSSIFHTFINQRERERERERGKDTPKIEGVTAGKPIYLYVYIQ